MSQPRFPDPSFQAVAPWEDHWIGMPEFIQERQDPRHALIVRFDSLEDLHDFSERLGQPVTEHTKSLWHPTLLRNRIGQYHGTSQPPRYPIYILSKGRWRTKPHTAHALDRMAIPYSLIVEGAERSRYAKVVDPATLLTLPPHYQDTYDPCDALGTTKSKGSGPARNFALDHARDHGAARHWLLDDNIKDFHRLNRNVKVPVRSAACFRAAEDFVDRYTNVPLAGLNYETFCKATDPVPPYILNTRIFSCLLIETACPFRWRARYNEDLDLSLRLLKAGYCTILFNAFLCEKLTTQKTQGGNTAAFYAVEGTRPKSEMIAALHPDVAQVVWRFSRWHHYVDYRPFRGTPLRRAASAPYPTRNEYGMTFDPDTKPRKTL